MISDELKIMSIKTALKDMFEKGYLCIITIRKVSELAGISIPSDIESFLSPLHCINFNKMPKELVNGIKFSIFSIFSECNKINLEFIDNIRIKTLNYEDIQRNKIIAMLE